MHDSLTKHAAQLARLAMMIRIGLESAEAAIPGINDLLAELAILGLTQPIVLRVSRLTRIAWAEAATLMTSTDAVRMCGQSTSHHRHASARNCSMWKA